MRRPLYVRPLTDEEQIEVEAGLKSRQAFVLRRCQIILSSQRGEHAPQIAEQVGCCDETVRDVIRAFNERGVAALTPRSRRAHRTYPAFNAEQADQLKGLLHHSPRQYGKDTSVWTLELAAEVSVEQGITLQRVSDETIRATLERLGVGWKRAKHWITSPDPQYARKKTGESGS